MIVLVLHHLGDPRHWRPAMVDHELCLPTFAPEHDYLVHDCALPLPEFVKDIPFDGVVLTQTFLGRRRHRRVFERVRREYAFVRDLDAFKIALPQDDYEHSAVLDTWLDEWRVDRIYTVCPEHWDVLYPRNASTGRLRLGYTGYVSDVRIQRWQQPKAWASRPIDVTYRSSLMPFHLGRIGVIKSTIGERFRSVAEGQGFTMDLSVDSRDVIVGTRWHNFLEDSKFVLGANSGSSMFDPTGSISEAVIDYQVRHPGASFEEVERACFPGVDGRFEFTALSPRNVECALIGSVQVLTPGRYSDVLEAGRHYLRMEPDLSNASELFAQMRDQEMVTRVAKDCKDAVLSRQDLRYDHHVRELTDAIASSPRRSWAGTATRTFVDKYRAAMKTTESWHWRRERVMNAGRAALVDLGGRRVKRLLRDVLGRTT